MRPHVGQEIKVAILEARPKDFNSSRATLTSSTGSAEGRYVMCFLYLLIGWLQDLFADFTVPANNVPDSVILNVADN